MVIPMVTTWSERFVEPGGCRSELRAAGLLVCLVVYFCLASGKQLMCVKRKKEDHHLRL